MFFWFSKKDDGEEKERKRKFEENRLRKKMEYELKLQKMNEE